MWNVQSFYDVGFQRFWFFKILASSILVWFELLGVPPLKNVGLVKDVC